MPVRLPASRLRIKRQEQPVTEVFIIKHKRVNMKQCAENIVKRKEQLRKAILTASLFGLSVYVQAQDGNAGINQATTMVKGYFSSGTNLMYAIGAITGLVGAIKVYQKWSNGHPDTGSTAAAWFGSCVFLVVVATVLKSFFDL